MLFLKIIFKILFLIDLPKSAGERFFFLLIHLLLKETTLHSIISPIEIISYSTYTCVEMHRHTTST